MEKERRRQERRTAKEKMLEERRKTGSVEEEARKTKKEENKRRRKEKEKKLENLEREMEWRAKDGMIKGFIKTIIRDIVNEVGLRKTGDMFLQVEKEISDEKKMRKDEQEKKRREGEEGGKRRSLKEGNEVVEVTSEGAEETGREVFVNVREEWTEEEEESKLCKDQRRKPRMRKEKKKKRKEQEKEERRQMKKEKKRNRNNREEQDKERRQMKKEKKRNRKERKEVAEEDEREKTTREEEKEERRRSIKERKEVLEVLGEKEVEETEREVLVNDREERTEEDEEDVHNMTAVDETNQISLRRQIKQWFCPLDRCGTSLPPASIVENTIMSKSSPPAGIENTMMSRALQEYVRHSRNRITGHRQSATTAACHESAIRALLPQGLSKASILALKEIGEDGGLIDSLLTRIKPGTVKTYLTSLAKFVEFLSGSFEWQRQLGIRAHTLQTLRFSLKSMAKSLDDEIHMAAVQRGREGDGLKITPQMFGVYLQGDRPRRVKALLQKEGPLSRYDTTEARDGLLLQLFISNGKRAGDLANLERTEVARASPADDGTPTELKIYEHKEARSGKECPLLVKPSLMVDLKAYVAKGCFGRQSKLVFTTKKGDKLSPTTMSKAVKREWERHGKEIGETLPSLTATICRKMAVSTLRDSGANRHQQRVLAKHMAHNTRTADSYYDCSKLKEARIGVWRKINDLYQDISKPTSTVTDLQSWDQAHSDRGSDGDNIMGPSPPKRTK